MPVVPFEGPHPFGDGAVVGFGSRRPEPPGAYPPPSETDAARLLRAAVFAAEQHSGQFRKDAAATPYVGHVITVASLLASVGGVVDIDVLCSGLIHDTLEDTDTTAAMLEAAFGKTVAGYVAEVSDDRSLHPTERKRQQVVHAPTLSPGAKLIKLADKIANVRDVALNPPTDWSEERRNAYRAWASQVVDGLRGCNVALEREFDEALRMELG